MNIVNRLTLRQLKLNRKRTIVTIIGAIISVAMITAVSILGISFMDLMQRQTIADNGEWHVLYGNINPAQYEAILRDSETKTVILSRDKGYALLPGSQNQYKPYIFIKEYNENGFEKFPVKLLQGRFPENPDEIAISEAIITNGRVNLSIGDVINLEAGKRYSTVEENKGLELTQNTGLQKENGVLLETLSVKTSKTYTIVGIIARPDWEPTWSPGYTALSYIGESFINADDTFNASVIVKKINTDLFAHAQELAIQNGIEKVEFHNELLRYYGVVSNDTVRNMLFQLSAIIMVIIMIGSISMIYNAFAISVSERSRYLGMLSSVGATKKQKRNSVLFEGAVIAAISIPIGIAAGLLGIGLTFYFINPVFRNALMVTEDLRVVVSSAAILAAVLISIVTIYISAAIPARRASKLSAIDAIRQTADVKLTGKEVKTSGLTRKLFGIEGDLALKNLKRNKRRYKATVFSLVISIILFLVVSEFTQELKKSISVYQTGVNYDIQVTLQGNSKEVIDDLAARIRSLNNVAKSAQIKTIEATSWIGEDNVPEGMKKNESATVRDGNYRYLVYINALDDDSLREYAGKAGVPFERLKDTKNPAAIVIDTIRYQENDRYVQSKTVNLRKGEMLRLSYHDGQADNEKELQSLSVAALTDEDPMGIISIMGQGAFNIVVSMDVLEQISGEQPNVSGSTYIYLNSSDPLRLQESIEAISTTLTDGDLHVYNIYSNRRQEEQMILIMSVFTYGFIALIAAISIANIINTISTGLALRKREFAMLKSVGMTPDGFGRMLRYESIFYGLKALLYGLPLSFAVMLMIHNVLGFNFSFIFVLPWADVGIAIASVFVIVGITMLYSGSRLKQDNIIDVLKQEII